MRTETRHKVFAEARSIIPQVARDWKVERGRVELTARALDLACHRVKAQHVGDDAVELFTDELHEEFQMRLADEKYRLPEVRRVERVEDERAPDAMTATYSSLVSALVPPVGGGGGGRTSPNKTATSLAAFKSAVAGLVPGDWLMCSNTTFVGETVIRRVLTSYARITFDSTCTFVGPSGANLPTLWIANPSAYLYLDFQGCAVTNPGGGTGILQYASNHIVFDGHVIHDTGGSGLNALPVGGDISDSFYRGEVYKIGLNHAYDPHAEKGSGLQGMILGDSGQGHFRNNQVAVYCHDCSYSGGSAAEIGDPSSSYPSYGNKLWVKAHAMMFKSVTQTGGNGVNAWGHMHDNDLLIVEADDMMGFAVSADLSGVQPGNVVEQGVATACVQNSRWHGQSPWQKQGGMVYRAVTPS
jgi:hypothetical protein